jgi:hypothetical protein
MLSLLFNFALEYAITKEWNCMDLREIGCEFVGWVHLAQDRDQWQALVNMAMNFWIPY